MASARSPKRDIPHLAPFVAITPNADEVWGARGRNDSAVSRLGLGERGAPQACHVDRLADVTKLLPRRALAHGHTRFVPQAFACCWANSLRRTSNRRRMRGWALDCRAMSPRLSKKSMSRSSSRARSRNCCGAVMRAAMRLSFASPRSNRRTGGSRVGTGGGESATVMPCRFRAVPYAICWMSCLTLFCRRRRLRICLALKSERNARCRSTASCIASSR